MLFRRRRRLRWWQRLGRSLWPTSGWWRAAQYTWHRLVRLKDSAHGVAAGLASGIAISVTPFVGFHLLGATALAAVTRGNFLAAWFGTLVGNPWTFPVIWLVIYRIGNWIVGAPAIPGEAERFSLSMMIAEPVSAFRPLLLPMTVGGVPLALASWFVSYWIARRAIERFQALRAHRLAAVRAREEAKAAAAGEAATREKETTRMERIEG